MRFIDKLRIEKFRLGLRKTLKQEPIELIEITKEEAIREIERRNK